MFKKYFPFNMGKIPFTLKYDEYLQKKQVELRTGRC